MKPLPDSVIARMLEPDVPFDSDDGDAFEYPPQKPVDAAPRSAARAVASGVCGAVASVARANDLPVPFFANLIWQESSFDTRASAAPARRASRSSCRRPRRSTD